MSTVSGACIAFKIAGMLYVKEDATPSQVEWTAIDQSKKITIPFSALINLQSSKESNPKMMLRIQYKLSDDEEQKDLKLTFSNRPTMNNIKESLQSVMARKRTVIKDKNPDMGNDMSSNNNNNNNNNKSNSLPAPGSGDLLDFSSPESLSDAFLLRNHALQQKLLLEDKLLREKFTHAVIEFKLSPVSFWSTRISQLRTYALTISQHRGMYNVLSTIKPVATSDNQVNVNVTRDTIREIFETYPVVKRAFDDLVPANFQEGEFWSRFFNSKLFRRLRGDKINNSNQRGDVLLDKYLYVDSELGKKPEFNQHKVSKLIDLEGNLNDDSQKLGNKPDFTMRFTDVQDDQQKQSLSSQLQLDKNGKENEILVIMRNMNKLSSKMINNTNFPVINEEEEINLQYQDLEELSNQDYAKLKINHKHIIPEASLGSTSDPEAVKQFISQNVFKPVEGGISLSSVMDKKNEIDRTSVEITGLIKHNWRIYRMGRNAGTESIIPADVIQNINNTHITCMELLTHFWRGFLSGDQTQAVATRKVMVLLKKCQQQFEMIENTCLEVIKQHTEDPKQREKLSKEVQNCLENDKNGLNEAFKAYSKALAELPKED